MGTKIDPNRKGVEFIKRSESGSIDPRCSRYRVVFSSSSSISGDIVFGGVDRLTLSIWLMPGEEFASLSARDRNGPEYDLSLWYPFITAGRPWTFVFEQAQNHRRCCVYTLGTPPRHYVYPLFPPHVKYVSIIPLHRCLKTLDSIESSPRTERKCTRIRIFKSSPSINTSI